MATDALTKKLLEILGDFGEKLADDTEKSLREKEHDDERGQIGLIGTVRFGIRRSDSDSLVWQFNMADYWEVLDKGRRRGGKKPPIKPLLDWMGRNNINGLKIYRSKLKDPSKSRVRFDTAQRGLAHGIATNIAKKGTIKRFGYKGSRFFSSLLEDGRIAQLAKDLSDLLGKQIEVEILNEVKDNNKILGGTI